MSDADIGHYYAPRWDFELLRELVRIGSDHLCKEGHGEHMAADCSRIYEQLGEVLEQIGGRDGI